MDWPARTGFDRVALLMGILQAAKMVDSRIEWVPIAKGDADLLIEWAEKTSAVAGFVFDVIEVEQESHEFLG